jgi:hypothetical protein
MEESPLTRRQVLRGSFIPLVLVLVGAANASADVINFENYSGPSVFGNAAQTLTMNGTSAGTVIISGGTILTAEAGLLADQSSVYGTCSSLLCGSNYSQTITITFSKPIHNFFLDVFNGQAHPDSFTVSDNVGHSVSQSITSGGAALISFPAAGFQVTISTRDPQWDFSIDNVGFDQAPPSPAPEPTPIMALPAGLIGIAALSRRLSRRSVQIG